MQASVEETLPLQVLGKTHAVDRSSILYDQGLQPQQLGVWHSAGGPRQGLHREGGLREEGAHVALAAPARQAQALRRVFHDVLHRSEQQRLRALLRRLRPHRAHVNRQPSQTKECAQQLHFLAMYSLLTW